MRYKTILLAESGKLLNGTKKWESRLYDDITEAFQIGEAQYKANKDAGKNPMDLRIKYIHDLQCSAVLGYAHCDCGPGRLYLEGYK